jgi:DNA-binding NarL/FixJ family response regulator
VEQVHVALQASTPLTHAGLVRYLRSHPRISLLVEPQPLAADVVVVCCPRITPTALAAVCPPASPAPACVVLVLDEITQAELLAAAQNRVVDILPRAALTADRLVRSVLIAARSDGVMPADLAGDLIEHIERAQREVLTLCRGEAEPSPREITVLRLMADGLDTAEIANELCYSERTVKNVIYGFTRRMDLRNRPHAVAYAVRAGLV